MTKPASDFAYQKKDDIELVRLYRAGDQVACTALLLKYAAMINKRISKYFIYGEDCDDLRQEAYMGLLSAIRTFDEGKSNSFYSYAVSCTTNRLKNALAMSMSKKGQLYKQSIPLEQVAENLITGSISENPEFLVIQNESYEDLMKIFKEHLSSFENDVLFLYLSGCDYSAVAKRLNTSIKSVGNALQRARKKLKSVLNDL